MLSNLIFCAYDRFEFFTFRKLWHDVTASLRNGDVTQATEHKTKLEERQREIERRRQEAELPVPTIYFQQCKGTEYDTYVYKGVPRKHSSRLAD